MFSPSLTFKSFVNEILDEMENSSKISDEAIQWYKSLNLNQKMGLKQSSELICGMKWEDFNILFSPRERLEILYNKLKMEEII